MMLFRYKMIEPKMIPHWKRTKMKGYRNVMTKYQFYIMNTCLKQKGIDKILAPMMELAIIIVCLALEGAIIEVTY